MTHRCAAGKGEAPTFLDWIPAPDRGLLRLSDGTEISYGSEADLIEICDGLARRRVVFSVAGILSPSPVDLMSFWQEQGRIRISFLRIAWRRPEEWELHEMAPGVQTWEPCSPEELLAAPPQAVSVADLRKAQPGQIAIRSLVPMASVASVPRSIEFYAGLGFECGNSHTPEGGTEPVWAWLRTRDGGQLMVAKALEPVDPKAQSVLYYVYCDDVAGLRRQLSEAGVEVGEITYPFYAPKGEFRVIDPDGYTLMVSHT